MDSPFQAYHRACRQRCRQIKRDNRIVALMAPAKAGIVSAEIDVSISGIAPEKFQACAFSFVFIPREE